MPRLELWQRPWALASAGQRLALAAGEMAAPHTDAPCWIYTDGAPPLVDNRTDVAEEATGFRAPGQDRSLWLLPFPTRRAQGWRVAMGDGICCLSWPSLPERPPLNREPVTEDEKQGHRLMLRAQGVWDRLSDVETALADPAGLWTELRHRWMGNDDVPPRRDIIVQQAIELSRTLERLERRPRHILRRAHRRIPVSRVQELDRRAMMWLARQPGETLAERAGDDQRVLAVAREESFDTLENRVLRAYAELAHARARDYLERNASRSRTRRARMVSDYGRRCVRIARAFRERGVPSAEPGVTPNYVLEQNAAYRAVWDAWRQLLRHQEVLDDLWRWQAVSWTEFSALCVMVALAGVPGARLIASSPLWFRSEQRRGSWVEHDNPLGVFHLPGQQLVAEVQRDLYPGGRLAQVGAPIWVRFGRIGDTGETLKRVAVWPIWSLEGGLVPGENVEIEALIATVRNAGMVGGVTLRPAASDRAEWRSTGSTLTLAAGFEGAALSDALEILANWLSARLVS